MPDQAAQKNTTIEGEQLALALAGFADEMQAEDIAILDLRGLSSIADYFVICTGTSSPHVKAIRREVTEKLEQAHGLRARASEGGAESGWLVLDYIDVILHIFHRERREVYSLEDLWSDAGRVPFEPAFGGGA